MFTRDRANFGSFRAIDYNPHAGFWYVIAKLEKRQNAMTGYSLDTIPTAGGMIGKSNELKFVGSAK
jgi:hypothetical protein